MNETRETVGLDSAFRDSASGRQYHRKRAEEPGSVSPKCARSAKFGETDKKTTMLPQAILPFTG
jgi:hypothetical protein